MRVAVGGIWHETNTFAAGRTGEDAFRAYQFARGPELIDAYRETRNELGGFIEGAARHGLTLVPLLFAGAVPSGVVTREAYASLRDAFLDDLRGAMPVDGVLLALHGAMVAEGVDDVEADFLAAVRRAVGSDCPVVATLDFHANTSAAMIAGADLLVGYDTYPHVDVFDRAAEAAGLMVRLWEGRPAKAFRKLPLLTAPQAQSTDDPPMRDVLERVRELERTRRLWSLTVACGFPYSDVGRLGVSVWGYGPDAKACVAEVEGAIWSRRAEFVVRNVAAGEAVRQAVGAPEGPVILVDVADNVGGGSPGDGTVLLGELLAARARGAVVMITDPEAVAAAVRAGEGRAVEALVGGKQDRRHGEPVRVKGMVRRLSDGSFVHRGSYMTGQRSEMGRTAVVESEGVTVVLMERRTMPFDAEQLRSLGIDPAAQRIIVVKSAIAWKAAYGAVAKRAITVATPGVCSADLASIPYTRRPRPLHPLDPA